MASAEQLAARAAEVDSLVLRAFEQTQPPVTLVAVGGYGRRELFPFSDVDLLLLTNSVLDGAARASVSEFLQLLWDQGLRVSQSVRTVEECCEIHEGNLELTISLLDQRWLAGEEARYEQLGARLPKFLKSQKSGIARHLCKMTRERHAKYADTIYHLEPNVKECPGGLRDIHVIHWLEKLTGSAGEPIDKERDFLFGVRIFLHGYFQRDKNILSFDTQEAISEEPANWMRSYYRNAREIFRAVTRSLEVNENSGSMISQFRDWRGRLSNADFTVSRELVLLRRPHELSSDPTLIIRLMQFVARHQLRLASDTERRVREVAGQPGAIAISWDDLRELLRLPRASAGLRAMQATGVLQRLVPEWLGIDCLVVRDFYHRYTVDEHTLVAMQSLENLNVKDHPLRQRFADLMNEIDRPELLRLALLFHDIGKGRGEGEHATESVKTASAVMSRWNVPDEAAGMVRCLIEQHLVLSSVMNSRDLGDPATGRVIAERVGTIEMLKLLTLLTYADISAVNPSVMTPWREEQLWRAYLAGYDELTKELETERIDGQRLLHDLGWFLEGFPTRYLRTHSEDEMRYHATLVPNGESLEAGLQLVRLNGAYRLTLVAADRPALLASVSGALASFGMNILKAEAFSNSRNLCLDTFVFSDPHRTLELNPPEAERLCDAVQRAIQGKEDLERLLQNRRKPQPLGRANRIQSSVAFNNAVSDLATLIEIVTEDRPALLFDLTRTISGAGCNIEVVLIDTEAHKAMDVFYVTYGGGKLPSEMEGSLKDALLGVCRA